jgi:hypothetical protein
VSQLLTFVTDKELKTNYIRQEYYRTKFVLFFVNLNLIEGPGVFIDLANLLNTTVEEFNGERSFIAVEVETLSVLKDISKSIIEYNQKRNTNTVNNMQIEFLSYAYGIEIGSNKYLDENVREEFLLSGKSPVYFEIQRTASKIPVLGVGGGSMSNLLSCRYVLTAKKHLKRALFVKRTGDIRNSKNQALVPILENDFVVDVHGVKPFDLLNEDLVVHLYRVVAIHETKIECEDITESKLDKSYIPKKVVEGAHIYHNTDGSYFCSEVKSKKLLITDEQEQVV